MKSFLLVFIGGGFGSVVVGLIAVFIGIYIAKNL
jgi:fluoride ion exporter CrcB/FEX